MNRQTAAQELKNSVVTRLSAPVSRGFFTPMPVQWPGVRQPYNTRKGKVACRGYLFIVQSKAKDKSKASKIRIPLTLELDALNLTLAECISECRDMVVSRYMLHHIRHAGLTKPGDKLSDKGIESRFKEARTAAGVTGAHPPTFHEIRSLSARLYKAQGVDAQALLGHKSAAMADLYQDVRGSEWITVAA